MDLRDQIKQALEQENQKSKGFGDTFEKIMIFTGIKRLVKWVYGDKDCGCDRRKDHGINGFPIMMKKLLVRKKQISNMYLRYPSLTKSFIIRKCPKILKLFIYSHRVQDNMICMGG